MTKFKECMLLFFIIFYRHFPDFCKSNKHIFWNIVNSFSTEESLICIKVMKTVFDDF